MKLTKIAMSAVILALFATAAHSQAYKADFSTKLVLAGGGADPVNSLSITSAAGNTSPVTLSIPSAFTAGTFVLVSNGTGGLTFASAAAGITLGGDVTGPANANAISALAGNDIVAAINNAATTTAINTPVDLTAKTLTAASGGTITTTGAIDGGTGVFTSTLSAVGLTSTGGLSTSGGAANISTGDVSAVNIGTGAFANQIAIGNALSTTTFLGAVSLPLGSVTAGSIGLAQNDLMVGDATSHGSALAPADNGVLVTG